MPLLAYVETPFPSVFHKISECFVKKIIIVKESGLSIVLFSGINVLKM